MLLDIQGQRFLLVDILVESILVPGFGEGHLAHRPLALCRRADTIGIQVRFAPARIATVEDVVIRMREYRPDVLVEPELLLYGLLWADKESLALESISQIFRYEGEEFLEYLQRTLSGNIDAVDPFGVLANEDAALVFGSACGCTSKLHNIL